MTPECVDPSEIVRGFLALGGEAITFDVFDSLLWREVLYPSDAFLLHQRAFPRLRHTLRTERERWATFICRSLLAREPRFSDIHFLSHHDAIEELEIEHAVVRANPFCLALVRELIDHEVPVACISDMYLSASEISSLIRKAGYPDLRIFSSASENCTKFHDGQLFHRAWRQLGKQPAEILHVGDNPHSDIAMALKAGAQVCQLITPRNTLFKLFPPTNRPSINGAWSLALGQLAITIHTHLGNDTTRVADARSTLAKLLEGNALEWPNRLDKNLLEQHFPSITLLSDPI